MIHAVVILAAATFAVIASSGLAGAQSNPGPQAELVRIAEDMIGTPDDDEAFESAFEGLLQMLSKPVNLNRADADDLVMTGILSPEQAQSIIKYRAAYGNFYSFYELQAVPGLELDVIEHVRPFVTVTEPVAAIDRALLKRITKESDNYLLLRLSRAWNEGDEEQSHIGSPEHLLLRFRSQRPGDFSFGLNTEKDAGEPIRWDPGHRYYGFDRWTFHAQLQHKGIVRNLIIGDFQAQFGQGLTLGGAFGPGKGAETITSMRRATVGLIPYTSAYESGNLRGAAMTLSLPAHLELSLFGSRARRDASIEELGEEKVATALQKSGLHRTEKELLGKQRLTDTQLGLVLQQKHGALEWGTMITYNAFDLPLVPRERTYNQYAFRGRGHTNAGCYFSYNIGRVATFGEVAVTMGKGLGAVVGVLGSVTRRLDVAVLVRNYAPDFHARFSNAISENSQATNEYGAYLGWRYQFSRKVSLTGYLDLFTFPWLRYRAYAPSGGYEWLWRLSYQPGRNVMLFAQSREESKMRNAPAPLASYSQARGTKNNYWIHAEVGLRDRIRFRTKVQWSRFAESSTVTHGFAVSQDLRVGWERLELTARFALFDTDNYDNRLYSYENDVLFAYSMPAYNGTGIRKMLMARLDLSRQLTLWVRYAETINVQHESLSPAQHTQRYALDRDVRVQLRIQF